MKATDILVAGHFNEGVNTKNVQECMVEMGTHKNISEVHEVDENDRDGMF